MNGVEVLKDLAGRTVSAASSLSEVGPERLNWHPGHPNSIAWLLWHTAREVDEQLSALSGEETEWVSGQWERKLGIQTKPGDVGYGHSAEQAERVVVTEVEPLLEHLNAVVAVQLRYLDTLTDVDLDEVIDERFSPPVTRGARLVSLNEDALQHIGQATYIAGMTADLG